MITAEFQPRLISLPEKVHVENPFVNIEIWRRDPSNIHVSQIETWTKSDSQIYVQNYKGSTIAGLHQGRTLASGNLSKTITVDKDGLYWVLLRVLKTPQSKSQTISLEIDGEIVKTFSSYSKWIHYKFLDFGYINIKIGRASCRERVCQYV
jgi:hypothetical protein